MRRPPMPARDVAVPITLSTSVRAPGRISSLVSSLVTLARSSSSVDPQVIAALARAVPSLETDALARLLASSIEPRPTAQAPGPVISTGAIDTPPHGTSEA